MVFVLAIVAARSGQAQTLSVLHTFTGGEGGESPASLIRNADGDLYGATNHGGVPGSCRAAGCGVVFKVDKTGNATVLHSFAFPFSEEDGAHPSGALVLDPLGNLYGTTEFGGTSENCFDPETLFRFGCGTAFKRDKTGEETVLYSLGGSPDGANVLAGLVRDAKGNLYGATFTGGNENNNCPFGCGVVFKLDQTGKETVLYRFTGTNGDGANPAALVLDRKGNIYGTTFYGGSGTCHHANPVAFGTGEGCGTVFKLDKTEKETVLYSFNGTDGANPPTGGLVFDSEGNLYGTTNYGGTGTCNDGNGLGCGTVFKLDTADKETVLHSFTENGDGTYPCCYSLVRDAMGNLYGTTIFGGTSNIGTVFKLDKTGEETVLYSFTGGSDGAFPVGLVRDPKGNLYGVASGGFSNFGTVFRLTE